MTFLKDLSVGDHFEGFYLIKAAEVRKTRAGKNYMAMTFQDRTGTISGNLWDAQPHNVEEFTPGRVVYMRATKELYNGMPQVNQIFLRLPENTEPNNPADFKEKPPVSAEELRAYVQKIIFKIENGTWNRIVRHIFSKYDEEFFKYPAAKVNHHAFETGLAFHTVTMVQLAEKITEIYPQLNESLMYAGILLHDMAKTIELSGVTNTSYTLAGNLIGHIVLIDEEVSKAVNELKIDEMDEDVILLRHVLLSHHGLLEYGSPVRPHIMEAEIIHMIDNLDASMMMMTTALNQVEPGEMTPRIFALDNRNLYKPHFDGKKLK
ncbi:3'-5' exoribonuclease YhaM family protein [Streptococcaceae bacterium ESL0729]|nr:3'-5' exoribonuclease YhaM family protein [Streptococcaceae bacterium ESL0729]